MRTQDEILAHIKEVDSFLDFQESTLMEFLDYKNAKPYLKDEVTEEEWKKAQNLDPVWHIRDYMPFAIEKASNHRGISAGRSIEHMRAWLWLLGDDETLAFADADQNYPNYGAPILKKICEKYQIEWPADNKALNNMAEGKECRPGCDEGCNS